MTRFKSSLLSRETIMMGTFSASTKRSFALHNKLSFGLHQWYSYIFVLLRHRQFVRSCGCRSLCDNVQILWAFWLHSPGQFRSARSQRHYCLIWWALWLLPSEAFVLLEWFDSGEVFSGLRRRLRLEQMYLQNRSPSWSDCPCFDSCYVITSSKWCRVCCINSSIS
jgi:hypothetical protein